MNADFLGVVQIVVYAGAVMALYAFGMMFFDSAKETTENIKNPKKVLVLSVVVAVLIVLMLSAPVALSGALCNSSGRCGQSTGDRCGDFY